MEQWEGIFVSEWAKGRRAAAVKLATQIMGTFVRDYAKVCGLSDSDSLLVETNTFVNLWKTIKRITPKDTADSPTRLIWAEASVLVHTVLKGSSHAPANVYLDLRNRTAAAQAEVDRALQLHRLFRTIKECRDRLTKQCRDVLRIKASGEPLTPALERRMTNCIGELQRLLNDNGITWRGF